MYRKVIRIIILLVIIGFSPTLYAQQADDEKISCEDLIEPKTYDELLALRKCLRQRKSPHSPQARARRIRKSIESSEKFVRELGRKKAPSVK